MLKCTFVANTRRDAVVMSQVAEALSSSSYNEKETFARAAAEALALARRITNSAAGAVYLISTHDRVTFNRIAEHDHDGRYAYPEQIDVDGNTTVARAVAQHRAYQHGGDETPSPLTRVVTAADGIELATPIAGPLGNTWEPPVGAVVLYQAPDSQGYGAYERALVRNVTLRLALMRTSIATSDIAEAISALRSVSLGRWQGKRQHSGAGAGASAALPKDLGLAVRRFAEPFQRLAESTRSHSISLRIALPDRQNAEHGLVLRRVAAHPEGGVGGSFEIQREGDPGPHWEVLRSGDEVYVPNTAGDRRFPQVRPGTRSALCVPVRVEGVLAGTLNLESPLIDNYTAFMPIIVALCGAMGRTLADARAELERNVLDRAAHALARHHEFSGDLEALGKQIHQLPPGGERDEMAGRIAAMGSIIADLRNPEIEDRRAPRTLWAVFVNCLTETPLSMPALAQPTDEIFFSPLDPLACRCLATVFQSVLRNMFNHSDMVASDPQGRPVPRAEFGRTTLAGQVQAVIRLENLTSGYLDLNLCRELYRYPVEGEEGELRLGAYIAGLNARRVDARIHGCALEDLRTFRTTIIVPVGVLK
jgi:GAF domain-containing protein